MANAYTTIHIRDFLRTDVNGVIDAELSRSVFRHMAELARAKAVPRILVDLRDSRPGLTEAEAVELVSDLSELGLARDTRVAILMPAEGDRLKRALYFQALAAGKGYDITPFVDFGAATEWLSEAV